MKIIKARPFARCAGSSWLPVGAVVAASVLVSFLVASLPPPAAAQTAGDSLYAVLYNGNGYYVFMNDLKFIFKTLKNDYGYTTDNIIVLSYDGSAYDLDGIAGSDIDFSATRANCDTVFARLSRVVTNDDVVFFYATDHGTSEYNKCADAALSVYSGDPIYEENLTSFFDRLDSPARTITKIIQLNTCYAGGMIPELSALDYPLMIMTASKECEAANHTYAPCDTIDSCDYCAYSFWWTSALHGSWPQGGFATAADYNGDGNVSIQEAARYAVANDEYAQKNAHPKEHPLYWDSDCIVGHYTTLNGRLASIPGMIAFRYPCHEPPPCRWGSWRCAGAGMGWPASGRDSGDGAAAARERVGTVLWSDADPAPGETVQLYARVRNPGDTPLSGAVVSFYYADPTLSLIYPQTGLNTVGTEYVPTIAPHDTVTVGPVPFVVPPGGNAWGEPYWTVLAAAEHPASPLETGWLENDDHVGANNRFLVRAFPAELKTVHFNAQNALDIPVKAVLSLDDSDWPSGWMIQMTPAPGDSIEIEPGSSVPVELRVMGLEGADPDGILDIAMELNTTAASACESCDDTTCGGYIGNAGGCSVKLVVEGTIGVAAPEFEVAATATAITLSWEFDGGTGVAFNVYRAEKGGGAYLKLNEAPITGSGRLSYADRTAASGKTYLYVLGVVEGKTERLSRPVEASLAGVLDFAIEQNYPNPFNPTTTIRFSLPETGDISVRVYDTAGELVNTLYEGPQTRGVHTLHWNGENAAGAPVSSGVYYCRVEMANGEARTAKLVILR